MGGYVNLAVRREGAVRKTLSTTGVTHEMFNPDIYLGSEAAIQGALDMFKGCPEVTDSDARRLAPYHYGLIVVDFDTKSVLDMQAFEWLRMCHLMMPGHKGQYLQRLGKMGWLDECLYSGMNGKPLDAFPEGIFDDESHLFHWMRGESQRDLNEAIQDSVKSGKPPSVLDLDDPCFVSFCLQPPGWTFRHFPEKNGTDYQAALTERGFTFTSEELAQWGAWREQYASS